QQSLELYTAFRSTVNSKKTFFLQLRRSTKETLSHHHFTKPPHSHRSRYTEGLFDQSSPQVYTRNQAQSKNFEILLNLCCLLRLQTS
ncbi:hypothetical protein PSQ20_15960, partial [Curvibacter sp. RS43]|uniref:hypothetical protein n=1 Tax=Curvibacter microcysteis TaxID=3026419 RepID=UPI00235E2521